jgi:hypothetical protein
LIFFLDAARLLLKDIYDNVDKLMSVNVRMVNTPLHTPHNRTGELQNLLVLIVFEMHSEISSGKFTEMGLSRF